MKDNPDIQLEFDPMAAGLARSRQQGQAVTKAALGKQYTGSKDFTLTDKTHTDAMEQAIKALGDTDEAYRLKNLWVPISKR